MAVACSTKKANPEKENHPANSDYNANKSAYHKICKKRVIDHAEPKSVPKSTQWAFFHRMDSFYSQFYETILSFFCGKAEMQKNPRRTSMATAQSKYPIAMA